MSELYHFGIKGQKWGVRRYQKKDGSLTPAGKKRYDKSFKDARELSEAHARLEDATRAIRKDVNQLGKNQKLIVPTEFKQNYSKMIQDYVNKSEVLKKKYSTVESLVITDKGKDYVWTLLQDPITGVGFESMVELHNQRERD